MYKSKALSDQPKSTNTKEPGFRKKGKNIWSKSFLLWTTNFTTVLLKAPIEPSDLDDTSVIPAVGFKNWFSNFNLNILFYYY